MSRNNAMADSSIRFLDANELAQLRAELRAEQEAAAPTCTCRNGGQPWKGSDGEMYVSQDPSCRVHPANLVRWMPERLDADAKRRKTGHQHSAPDGMGGAA